MVSLPTVHNNKILCPNHKIVPGQPEAGKVSIPEEGSKKEETHPIWSSFCTPVTGITGEAPGETSPE